jgi:hypothetical protein
MTVEDTEDTRVKRVHIVGSEPRGVLAVVADVQALVGPRPLLSGVPVSQAVYDRLRALDGVAAAGAVERPERAEDSARLLALGSFTHWDAVAWVAERQASCSAAAPEEAASGEVPSEEAASEEAASEEAGILERGRTSPTMSTSVVE